MGQTRAAERINFVLPGVTLFPPAALPFLSPMFGEPVSPVIRAVLGVSGGGASATVGGPVGGQGGHNGGGVTPPVYTAAAVSYHSDPKYKDRFYINIQSKWFLYFGSEWYGITGGYWNLSSEPTMEPQKNRHPSKFTRHSWF